MAGPNQAFETLLKRGIAPRLKRHGFTRKRQTFYLQRGENLGLINLQKSTTSTADASIFTMNLGVASARLRRFADPEWWTSRSVSILDCQWETRIGSLLPGGHDKWWSLAEGEPLAPIIDELIPVLEDVAVPTIEQLISDEGLRNYWLACFRSGGLGFLGLKHLSVLLKALGPEEDLQPVLDEMWRQVEGQPAASTARVHFKRLNRVSVG